MPIEKVINIAKQEIGYLEKASNESLYHKTANAGSKNYTKYWKDIYPKFQGEPWCACFVTWCFTQAFGQDNATKLLRHYPFTYCPTMANLFTLNANPKVGDIVLFYRNGEFVHTGIVISVEGDYFVTIEGNTSDAKKIIPNGGCVCMKGYYNSQLPGTKFCTPDWNLVKEKVNFTEKEIKFQGQIIASELNVREQPSTNSKVLAKHIYGDIVDVIAETSNGWYKVYYPQIGFGYISSKYVEKTLEEELTKEEFYRLLNNYLSNLAYEEPFEWSKNARLYCENANIIKGDEKGNKKYRAYLTREELAVILYNLFGKRERV